MIKRLHSSHSDHFIIPAMLCNDGLSSVNGTYISMFLPQYLSEYFVTFLLEHVKLDGPGHF